MDATTKTALIGLGGVVLGLVVRDVVVQLYVFRKKRKDDIENLYHNELIKNRDVARLYADPLLQSCKGLNFRFKEMLDQEGRAEFLLPQTPQSTFVVYKRISTLYRLAALLGWIKAYRTERSYLDPADAVGPSELETAVGALEAALADGPHVETQRLKELLRLWVPSHPAIDNKLERDLAVAVDNLLRSTLTREEKTSALELSEEAKQKLCVEAARIISKRLKVDVPQGQLTAELDRAVVFFGIKEAWVYRDWQQAIGDLVLTSVSGSSRRFDVMGYLQFESMFLSADEAHEAQRRWIQRLDALFVGLEPHKKDVVDARRDQLRRVHEESKNLQRVLEQKVALYSKLTAKRELS
jgi:hypothetical protein